MGTSDNACRNISTRTNSTYSQRICSSTRIHVGSYTENEDDIHLSALIVVCFLYCSNRYGEALTNYEKGMDKVTLDCVQLNDTALEKHKQMCEFGIARTNIKLGNLKKGVRNEYSLWKPKKKQFLLGDMNINNVHMFILITGWTGDGIERQAII